VERRVYEIEAEVEARHWWFSGRRLLFAREIERAGKPSSLLDIGVGSGSNLRMFRDRFEIPVVIGVDPNVDVIEICRANGLVVEYGDVLALPFPNRSFDAVVATDVIEHVEDDATALGEVFRVLRPGGFVLLTVPAFTSLWGLQDVVARHYRRYRLGELKRLVLSAGFAIERAYYFNYLLFVPIFIARWAIRVLKISLDSENEVNSHQLNAMLSLLFRLDINTAGKLHPPFGVSALVVARKPM
jgi:ubiquinone/menaquinone biosynthesis C-methylase UbiE